MGGENLQDQPSFNLRFMGSLLHLGPPLRLLSKPMAAFEVIEQPTTLHVQRMQATNKLKMKKIKRAVFETTIFSEDEKNDSTSDIYQPLQEIKPPDLRSVSSLRWPSRSSQRRDLKHKRHECVVNG